ncbi:NnrT protein [Cereibacter azotoformans]|uniref:NnrT protein n=1 Tax=Cereibacter TaxID=1653176 RepID=UPI000C6D06EF|nr:MULTISPECIES: NnrT protein [Cereibacter]
MSRQRRVTLLLYPFGAGAAAVNLFFASLILSWVGLPVLSPAWSVLGGMILGIPATHLFAGHIVRLMERAETQA